MNPPDRRFPVFAIVGGVLLGAAAMLYFFPPEQYRLYPKCTLYAWTGLKCPGCGGLRAAHQLLHGHFVEAFRLNPLLFVLAPVVLLLSLSSLLKPVMKRDWLEPLRRPAFIWLFVGIAVVFAIVRNLPWRFWDIQ